MRMKTCLQESIMASVYSNKLLNHRGARSSFYMFTVSKAFLKQKEKQKDKKLEDKKKGPKNRQKDEKRKSKEGKRNKNRKKGKYNIRRKYEETDWKTDRNMERKTGRQKENKRKRKKEGKTWKDKTKIKKMKDRKKKRKTKRLEAEKTDGHFPQTRGGATPSRRWSRRNIADGRCCSDPASSWSVTPGSENKKQEKQIEKFFKIKDPTD